MNLADLKAVFFVKTFAGNPDYTERNEFQKETAQKVRRWRLPSQMVRFCKDRFSRYRMQETGLFLFPANSKSNNLTLFVVNAAVKKFRYLRSYSITTPRRESIYVLDPGETGDPFDAKRRRKKTAQISLTQDYGGE